MFENFFNTKSFYFSDEYDLTNPFSVSAARQFSTTEFEDRFYYNSTFTGKLKDVGLTNWVQPFICGLIEQKLLTVNSKKASFTLISRRDKSRAGLRFTSRGADAHGNVSNFAETEQILTFINEDHFEVLTYLQTRGSIPLLWKQPPNLKWAPTLKIEPSSLKLKSAYESHMMKMKRAYSENYLINLIDMKGSQKKIGDYFTEVVRSNDDPMIKYKWFDFHHECRKMQWHNLSKLINDVSDSINKFRYGQFRVPKSVGEAYED